ncbi:MAG: GNAT family N-acetyltransferase [Pseudomonadota bacterium]
MTVVCTLDAGHAKACAVLHASGFDRPWSAASISGLLLDNKIRGWGIPSDDASSLSAFALFRVVDEEADFLTITTHPESRSRGFASSLITHAATDLALLGVKRLTLEVSLKNAAAIALYHRLGFTRDGHRPAYYVADDGERIDAMLMSSTPSRIAGLLGSSAPSTQHD